jgi:uncharacterized protein (DUF302 family)
VKALLLTIDQKPHSCMAPIAALLRHPSLHDIVEDHANRTPGGSRMKYYIERTLSGGFDDAVARTIAALKTEGFGVLTDIDVKETMKKKINVDIPSYRILGACNPMLAYEALKLEHHVGTMLPCNVIVRDAGGGQTEVAAVDPVASMMAIDNPALKAAAQDVRTKLARVIENL